MINTTRIKLRNEKIIYQSPSDALHRCQFTLTWEPLNDFLGRTFRAQVFYADPHERGYPRPEELP